MTEWKALTFKQPLSLMLSLFTLWHGGVKLVIRTYQLWQLPGQGRWHWMRSVVVHCIHQFQATSLVFRRWWWWLLYIALFSTLELTHWPLRSHVILHEWLAFYSAFLNLHQSGVLTWLVPHETAAISAQVLRTPYTMSLHAKLFICMWGWLHFAAQRDVAKGSADIWLRLLFLLWW